MVDATDLALRAFDMRPTRAESLADLARTYRERGMNESASMFARRGLAILPTDDLLFVETGARAAMMEDLSITGYYSQDPETRQAAHLACDQLALDRNVSRETRELARRNLHFYLKPIAAIFPSWQIYRMKFAPPDGYAQMAPSVALLGTRIVAAARTVNYKIDERGYVQIKGDLPLAAGGRIHTRTFMLDIDPDTFRDNVRGEILLPDDLPAPANDFITGFEDMRLFAWRGELWSQSTVLEQNPDAHAEQWLARIGSDLRMCEARCITPERAKPREKNWIAVPDESALTFIYESDPTRIIDINGQTIGTSVPDIAVDNLSGGTPAIPFDDGWLAIVHWREWFDGWPHYRHRWIWYDNHFQIKRLSPGWVLSHKTPEIGLLSGYEYCTGLCWHPDGRRVVVGYHLHEREAWVGVLDKTEISSVMDLPQKIVETTHTGEVFDWDLTALDRAAEVAKREHARHEFHKTLKSPIELFPSWNTRRLQLSAPDGFATKAPSVINHGGRLLASLRIMNYAPTGEPNYRRIADGAPMGGDVKPVSRALLVEFDAATLEERVLGELKMPRGLPKPRDNAQSYGFEDLRLFDWGGDLWAAAAFAEQSVDGLPEQWLVRIDPTTLQMSDARHVIPRGIPRRTEKNWAPMLGVPEPQFLYVSDPTTIIDAWGHIVSEHTPEIAAEHFHGGSQLVKFGGGWLGIVHWCTHFDQANYWFDFEYRNRFIWLDADFHLKRVSPGWTFPIKESVPFFPGRFQLVHGLAWHTDGKRLVIGYDKYESEPWIATVDADEVERVLESDKRCQKSEAQMVDDGGWVAEQTNGALANSVAIDHASELLRALGLPGHGGSYVKNWDTLLAVWHARAVCRADDPILDAGGDGASSFLRGMARLGYKNLLNINIDERRPREENGIRFQHGNITATELMDKSQYFVMCQSVLEHNVDWVKFFDEMARIMMPEGRLFVSIDYWHEPIETNVKIFTPGEVRDMIGHASTRGLQISREMDYRCHERAVIWNGLAYTFLNMLFIAQ